MSLIAWLPDRFLVRLRVCADFLRFRYDPVTRNLSKKRSRATGSVGARLRSLISRALETTMAPALHDFSPHPPSQGSFLSDIPLCFRFVCWLLLLVSSLR